jgi:hypothetical protein
MGKLVALVIPHYQDTKHCSKEKHEIYLHITISPQGKQKDSLCHCFSGYTEHFGLSTGWGQQTHYRETSHANLYAFSRLTFITMY